MIASLILLSSIGLAVSQGPELTLRPCTIEARDARCGTLRVPEDRTRPQARRIALHIVVITAREVARPDPIVFIAGGPGQGAARIAPHLLQQLQGIDEGRDVIFVDQRGTGESNGLTCAGSFELVAASRRDDLTACRRELSARADLAHYGTAAAVADLEDVRAALRYDTINLVAASYGTRVALEYIRRHPARVRTALLRAVAPAGFNILYDGGLNAEAALRRVLDDCRADAQCRSATGDPHENLRAVRSRLATKPETVEVPQGGAGAARRITITEDLFAQVVYALLLTTDTRQSVPLVLYRAATSGFQAIAPLVAGIAEQLYGTVAFGMYLSVVCSEDAARLSAEQRNRLASTAPLVNGIDAACRVWNVGGASADLEKPVRADTPTLVISGVLDPATPASAGDEATRHLPNSRHIVLPATSHAPLIPTCAVASIKRFLDRADAKAVDARCASDAKLKPFAKAP